MNYSDLGFWFSTDGRVNRQPYFFYNLFFFAIAQAQRLLPENFRLFYLPVILLCACVGLFLGIKRCHDRDKSGFFLLLNFIPILNLWPIIELTFFKGTSGSNEYGADPLA